MIATLCLFHHRDIFVKLLFFGESNAVNPLQHLVGGVALPVGASDLNELHGLDCTRRHQVRAGAEICKIALLIKRDLLPFGQLLNELNFIGLSHLFGKCNGLGPGQREPLDGLIVLHNFYHFGLKLFEVFRRKGGFHVDIVIKSALNRGPDGELCLGIEPLYGLGQYMGAGVPEGLLAGRMLKGDKFHRTVFFKRRAQVGDFTVDKGGANFFAQLLRKRLGRFKERRAGRILTDRAVHQCDFYHENSSNSQPNWLEYKIAPKGTLIPFGAQ
ncbi:hypothetical protein SDC9_104395 [bioreactor metagenome]|uniref:Uncharacterized protein n=1 Tax=bioreactor metagenome TaxID=1076179 RepID=A0A645B336_9ZZZZ